jgi:hypothetical protein
LDLVSDLDGIVQDGGLVRMQSDFFTGHILHHVKFAVDLQKPTTQNISA